MFVASFISCVSSRYKGSEKSFKAFSYNLALDKFYPKLKQNLISFLFENFT